MPCRLSRGMRTSSVRACSLGVDVVAAPQDEAKAQLQELAELEEVLEGALRLLAPAIVRRFDTLLGDDDVKRARLELSAALSKVRRRMGQQGRTRVR